MPPQEVKEILQHLRIYSFHGTLHLPLSLGCSHKHNTAFFKIMRLYHVEVVRWTFVSLTSLYPKTVWWKRTFFLCLTSIIYKTFGWEVKFLLRGVEVHLPGLNRWDTVTWMIGNSTITHANVIVCLPNWNFVFKRFEFLEFWKIENKHSDKSDLTIISIFFFYCYVIVICLT